MRVWERSTMRAPFLRSSASAASNDATDAGSLRSTYTCGAGAGAAAGAAGGTAFSRLATIASTINPEMIERILAQFRRPTASDQPLGGEVLLFQVLRMMRGEGAAETGADRGPQGKELQQRQDRDPQPGDEREQQQHHHSHAERRWRHEPLPRPGGERFADAEPARREPPPHA